MNNKAAQAYFQTKVSTTDQGQLLLLLYDGALKFLQQAREKMLEKDYAAKGLLISRVIDIVNELSNTLNLERGGTLAENLNNLYFLCTTRLLQANLKMNVEQLDSVAGILSGLRSAYAQIINTPEAQQAAAQIATKLNAVGSMSQRPAHITAPAAAPAPIGQVQARMAYGQQTAVPAAAPAPPAPLNATTPQAVVTAMPKTAMPVSQTGQTGQAGQPVQAAPAPAPVSAQAAAPTAPAAQAVTKDPQPAATGATTGPTTGAATGLAQGLAAPQLHRRLASYAKMG